MFCVSLSPSAPKRNKIRLFMSLILFYLPLRAQHAIKLTIAVEHLFHAHEQLKHLERLDDVILDALAQAFNSG